MTIQMGLNVALILAAAYLLGVLLLLWGIRRDVMKDTTLEDLRKYVEANCRRYDDDGKDMSRVDYARLKVPGYHGVYSNG